MLSVVLILFTDAGFLIYKLKLGRTSIFYGKSFDVEVGLDHFGGFLIYEELLQLIWPVYEKLQRAIRARNVCALLYEKFVGLVKSADKVSLLCEQKHDL